MEDNIDETDMAVDEMLAEATTADEGVPIIEMT